jgi:hypothetical protein
MDGEVRIMKTAYAIHLKETPILALPHHPSYHISLWWNNDNGWGHKATADIFTPEEQATLNLPLDGEWVEIYVEETEAAQ